MGARQSMDKIPWTSMKGSFPAPGTNQHTIKQPTTTDPSPSAPGPKMLTCQCRSRHNSVYANAVPTPPARTSSCQVRNLLLTDLPCMFHHPRTHLVRRQVCAVRCTHSIQQTATEKRGHVRGMHKSVMSQAIASHSSHYAAPSCSPRLSLILAAHTLLRPAAVTPTLTAAVGSELARARHQQQLARAGSRRCRRRLLLPPAAAAVCRRAPCQPQLARPL